MLTTFDRAYEIARRWMPDSPPDSMRLAALTAHIKIALDKQAAEAVELVRQLLPYVVIQAVIMPGSDHEIRARAAKDFLRAHGVEV